MLLASNRKRNDGLQEDVEVACVEALTAIAGPKAAAILGEELSAFAQSGRQDLEYGSTVVQALKKVGQSDGVAALESYAATLDKRLSDFLGEQREMMLQAGLTEERIKAGEEMIRRSYQEKAAEARGTAAGLRAP
jgi:hypothetical protein